jgi:NADH:ubiquinone oxidoreductase subunit 3 (subunit A)
MAKVKGKKGQDKSKSVEVSPKRKPDSPDERLGFFGYLLLCVIFAVICGIQILMVWLFTGETIGLDFFFISLIIVFIVAALYTWIYDLFSEWIPKGRAEKTSDIP